jgi:hypothetical protein
MNSDGHAGSTPDLDPVPEVACVHALIMKHRKLSASLHDLN